MRRLEICDLCRHDGSVFAMAHTKDGAICGGCRQKGLSLPARFVGPDFAKALALLIEARELVEKNRVQWFSFKEYHGL